MGVLRSVAVGFVHGFSIGFDIGVSFGCAVWFVGDEGELGDLAVDKRVRRNGVGSLLLHAVVEEGRQRALHRLFLEVRESNDGAQSLYSRHGFEIVGSRRNYYTNPVEDAVLMQFLLIR